MTTYFDFDFCFDTKYHGFYISFNRQINNRCEKFSLTYNKFGLWGMNFLNKEEYKIKPTAKYEKIIFSNGGAARLFFDECLMPQMIAINLINENIKFKF